ncbi:autotransporter outer membrane beta-barrel domain-containing protein [Pseudomonas sp. 21LCFQ010]|uniref:autotransporter outer membrane beta-barrel domain-containing protein n=1 Tax=Pseudomonas sp. 21LCFQ010 TaxID=2957506 RepID=UPI0020976018|nr:autotransporter outer membrane beta-barrel domain-containing protein [Pseudomonas sp. 21LCFQ010]MCO8160596.1 autotransporter outer membrane beta-barrel domain-containing protein [Pseudomonas sp. 21LCFQ010]
MMLVCAPLMAESSAYWVPIDNERFTIDASYPVESYSVINGAYVLATGAEIKHMSVMNSDVDVERGTRIFGGMQIGGKGRLTVSDSSITNERAIGLTLHNGFRAYITDSVLAGHGAGLSVAFSYAYLENVKVFGTGGVFDHWSGWGIGVLGGEASISRGSHITGDEYAIYMTHPETAVGVNYNYGKVQVNNSTLESFKGAAIRVEGRDGIAHKADIDISAGSILLSGNGNLLETFNQSTTHFTVDNSRLTGNLVADETSTLNITLQNNAQLTGNIINGNRLALASGGYWQMTGDNSLKTLNMDGGAVGFGDGAFKTLSLNELSGHGNFAMRVDLDHGIGDLLNVNGQANGQFGLRVQNTGLEVVSPDLQPLRVVHTEGGNAQFNLIGDRVDLGVYSYGLEQQGNDWFIVGQDKTISPSTGSALALFNAAPVVWMGELSTLRSRMGEVRGTGLGGGWMRAYGNRFEASTSDGIDYRHKQQGFSLGADVPVPVGNGQLSLGVMAGHSQSDLDLSRGSSGTIDSVYVGTYGTWLSEQGYYLDAVLKLNRLRNKAKVAMSDNTRAKGDYDNTAVGASLEFGRQIRLADGWFVEPYTQLAMVDVQGEGYRMDNGLRADNSHTRSVLAKAGASLGRDIALKDGGVLQPYVRLAAAQEFSRNNEVKVNDRHFDNDLSGSRMEVGAGVSVSLSERLQLHADFDYMNGKRVEQPWGANVGLRFAF